MKIPVHIYAFVGVIGSGKSYRLEQMKNSFNGQGQISLVGDFSDGIRDLVKNIFGYNDNFGDVNSSIYRRWKDGVVCQTSVAFPEINSKLLTGREILRNVGESVKLVAGEDVWAKYTIKTLRDRIQAQVFRSDVCVKEIQVLIGSVRFRHEARAVFDLYEQLLPRWGQSLFYPDVHFILCDYHSKDYNADSSHISEAFAQTIINDPVERYRDGDDVSKYVQRLCR